MKKRSLVPTNHTYCSLFSACARAGPKASPVLAKLRDELERREHVLNALSINALMSALAVCGQGEETFEAYLALHKKGVEPSAATFGSLLQAAVRDGESGLEHAQQVWEEMRSADFAPDQHSYNLLLQCLRDAGVPASMTRTTDTSRAMPDVTLASLGLGKEAEEVWENHQTGRGVQRERIRERAVVTVALAPSDQLALFLGGAGRGRVRWVEEEGVKGLLDKMAEGGAPPDIRSFHILASLVMEPGWLLGEMGRRGVEPDQQFMTAAIRMQASLPNLPGAKVRTSSRHTRVCGHFHYTQTLTCTQKWTN